MSEPDENKSTENIPFMWLVRPCVIYKEEYSDCTGIRGRFHQYFVHGTTVDCRQMGRELDYCKRWEEDKDMKALESLIESEKKRRTARLETYVKNDVMSLREKPPEDWDKPLPEWLVEEYETTYLAAKAVEMRNKTHENTGKMCTIL